MCFSVPYRLLHNILPHLPAAIILLYNVRLYPVTEDPPF